MVKKCANQIVLTLHIIGQTPFPTKEGAVYCLQLRRCLPPCGEVAGWQEVVRQEDVKLKPVKVRYIAKRTMVRLNYGIVTFIVGINPTTFGLIVDRSEGPAPEDLFCINASPWL